MDVLLGRGLSLVGTLTPHGYKNSPGMWKLGCKYQEVGRYTANSCADCLLSSMFIAGFPFSAWAYPQMNFCINSISVVASPSVRVHTIT